MCVLVVLLQTVYDQAFIALYNLMYTALPVLGMGLFDQVQHLQTSSNKHRPVPCFIL